MTKPDGYCAWSPKSGFEVEHTFCDTPEECEMRARWELGIIGEIGVDWLIKPVKIVPLEEWERLRKLELWALEASAALKNGEYRFEQKLGKELDAIMEGEK